MRALIQMTLYQFRTMMRNKIALFFNLAFPLMFLGILGSMSFEKPPGPAHVGLVNLDQSTVAADVTKLLTSTGAYEVEAGDEADLTARLADNKLDAVIVVPSGTAKMMESKRGPAPIRVLFDKNNASSGMAVSGLQPLISGMGTQPVTMAIPEAISTGPRLSVMDYLLPGQLMNMLLSAGLTTVAISLAEQRKNGSMRHLFSTPLSMPVWITSRICANLVMALIQISVLFGFARLVFGASLPDNLFGTAVVLVLGALMTLGLGLVVGVFSPSPEAAQPFSLIAFMSMLFLGGAMFPIEMMPSSVAAIAKMTPGYYLNESLRAVMMVGEGLGGVAFELTVIGVTALITVSLATWRIRQQFVRV